MISVMRSVNSAPQRTADFSGPAPAAAGTSPALKSQAGKRMPVHANPCGRVDVMRDWASGDNIHRTQRGCSLR